MSPPTVSSWKSTFNGHSSQDVLMDKFKSFLSNGASHAQRISDACSDRSIAFLAANTNNQILILHHLHHDCGNPLDRRSNDIWSLWGSDNHAIPMIIPPTSVHKINNTPTILAPSWADFCSFSNIDEIKAYDLPKEPTNPTVHQFRPNAWVQPIPAFVTRALMTARSQDPFTLCLAAKDAIVAHANALASQDEATQDATLNDSVLLSLGSNLTYILQFLWSIANNSTKETDAEFALISPISTALSSAASEWSSQLHSTVIANPFPSPNTQPDGNPTPTPHPNEAALASERRL